MKKLTICFDIDNVICKTLNGKYKKSIPIKKNIKIINLLKNKGHYIKLFTARCMGRSKENKILAKRLAYKLTVTQLKKWNVNYNEVIFGKPSFDLYIDDKSLFFKKNWNKEILKKIRQIVL